MMWLCKNIITYIRIILVAHLGDVEMNIANMIGNAVLAVGVLLMGSSIALAFTNDDEAQAPSVTVPESCTISTTAAAAVTKANLESGVTNDATIFGTVTGTCNSASGFKYQIKADGNVCEFKHATLANSSTYTINATTPATSNGSGAVTALLDTCPDNTTGYVTIWTVTAGSTHVSNTVQVSTTIGAAGVSTLPDGVYSENVTVRLSDI